MHVPLGIFNVSDLVNNSLCMFFLKSVSECLFFETSVNDLWPSSHSRHGTIFTVIIYSASCCSKPIIGTQKEKQ